MPCPLFGLGQSFRVTADGGLPEDPEVAFPIGLKRHALAVVRTRSENGCSLHT